jgi:hypothetical protein
MATDQEQLRAILASLGSTQDSVAATLKSSRIRGVRNAARFLNPIVRYAQRLVTVDALSLDLMKQDTPRLRLHDGAEVETVLPEAVRGFLDAFNRGDHPDLELPPEKI